MNTKEQRLAEARALIEAQPTAGRRDIGKQLRESGLGLRDATILSLQREAYPERRRIVVEPYQFAGRVEARYKPIRRGRYNKLVKMNFSASEARTLSKLPLTMLSHVKDMAKARKKLISDITGQGKQLGWDKTQLDKELKDYLGYTYQNEGWVNIDGEDDPWAMLRAFRKGAIDRGEYTPRRPRKRPHSTPMQKTRWRSVNKEKIKQQAGVYRQKERDKREKSKR